MSKPILCVDFDGVIHSYSSGWQGASIAADPPVPGAMEFLKAAAEHFRVCIYSSRTKEAGGISTMMQYLVDHGGPVDLVEFPSQKPAAFLTIDDRAFPFRGIFPEPKSLLDFKPWNKA